MPLTLGTTLGPYEIQSPLGAGGMGEVYKARDTRLDRTVAIKVLPAHVADDPDLRQRFEREAKTISSLNHPHICTLYDIGQQDGVDYLVMEYLEGETLAARLTKGPLPTDQVLRYATEIADALDKAHRKGITHRDLKPGNIMITKAGTKLLDFGLAKLKQPAAGPGGMSAVPTLSAGLTMQGTILGTLQYMAPEQLEGTEADARTDIFAFGAVVYEMATGKKAFEGKSQASLIAAILEREPPPISVLQPVSPPAMDQIVKTCLAKDPDDRWQSAGDLGRQLKIIQGGSQPSVAVPTVAARKSRERLSWGVAGVLAVLLAIALAVPYVTREPADLTTVRFTVEAASRAPNQFALSPDGRHLAFVGEAGLGGAGLWIRAVEALEARMLPGTEGAGYPFWSPDNQFIGFFVGGQLKKVAVSGGPPETLCEVAFLTFGGTWNRDDVIVFGRGNDRLYRVSASGGEPSPVTELDRSLHSGHVWPQFFPDGRRFLFFAGRPGGDDNGIYVGSLDSTEVQRVMAAEYMARYAPPGYLLYAREGTLMAQPFDADAVQLTGDPVRLVDQVSTNPVFRLAAFSVSENGELAYRGGGREGVTQLVWFDRSGELLGEASQPGLYNNPALSRDETRVAVERREITNAAPDVWILDLTRGGTPSRFTFDPEADRWPTWSPDGRQIAFGSDREGGVSQIYRKNASGTGEAELLLESEASKYPMEWSEDGAWLSFFDQDSQGNFDLWVLPLAEDSDPIPFLQTPFADVHGRLSPDSRWMAYGSDESGQAEIYVQDFPESGGKWPISTSGGFDPQWRGDGNELFYLGLDGNLMAVEIEADGDTPVAGIPQVLFPIDGPTLLQRNNYDVTADGQRFLVNAFVEDAIRAQITWVLNWTAELEQ